MSGGFIILYDSQYKKMLEDAINPEKNILKWYCTDHIETELVQIGLEIMRDGYVKRMTKIVFIVGTHRRRSYVHKMFLTMGFLEEQLINVYQLYWGVSRMYYKRCMMHMDAELDGIILGISHGKCGITAARLPGKVCNLCCSSQDIYFNFKTIRNLFIEYPEQLKNVKYVIMDMFDYTYFNYDTLLAGENMTYLEESGFECEFRNGIEKRKNVCDINQYLHDFWQEGSQNIRKREILKDLLPKMNAADGEWWGKWEDSLTDRDAVLSESQIEEYEKAPRYTSIQINVYEETIGFQAKAFEKLLCMLEDINPHIRMFAVMLPKYYVVERFEAAVNEVWRKAFLTIIESMEQRYRNFKYVDFKNTERIQQTREYWADLTHLNKAGAAAMTDCIRERLATQYGLHI